MKINMGAFPQWWGSYQIVEALCFWVTKHDEKGNYTPGYDKVHAVGEWLSNTWVHTVLQWIHSKRKRKVEIRIDNYDTWSMDSTLGKIILPMLIQLNEKKHGAPFVDDTDVPDELKSTSAPAKKNEWDVDENHFKRWDWVMGEMIWAFTQIDDEDNDAQFHTGDHDVVWVPLANGNSEMTKGPKDTHVFDKDGYMLHHARVKNGTTLFGKYYSGLWD